MPYTISSRSAVLSFGANYPLVSSFCLHVSPSSPARPGWGLLYGTSSRLSRERLFPWHHLPSSNCGNPSSPPAQGKPLYVYTPSTILMYVSLTARPESGWGGPELSDRPRSQSSLPRGTSHQTTPIPRTSLLQLQTERANLHARRRRCRMYAHSIASSDHRPYT